MRTIIDLPEAQIKALDGYRRRKKISRAEAIRQAINAFLPTDELNRQCDFRNDPAFGSSKPLRRRDSLKTVRQLRQEWDS